MRGIESAPTEMAPFDALAWSLELTGDFFRDRRDFVLARHHAITASRELQERELSKLDTLSTALAGALRGRDVASTTASLLGDVGVAAFKRAYERWVADDHCTMDACVRNSIGAFTRAINERA